jgi:CDP-diacylglycerol--serine O-phosphatidyltransferase
VYFKAKDYVTAGNAVCGLASVVCIIEGGPNAVYYASFLICASWIFDALDGVVARLTNTFNKFGGEFDTMCDHLSYGIAPGFVIYGVYRDWMPGNDWQQIVLASVIAFWLPLTASIRSARLTVKPVKVKGFWIGLPRPVSAFVAVSWFNTSTVALYPEVGYVLGLLMVFGLGVSNLGAFPFLSHHNSVWHPFVRTLLKFVLASLIIVFLGGPIPLLFGVEVFPKEVFFDLFWFLLFGYATMGWAGIPDVEWQKVREAVAEWRLSPEPE